MYPGIKYSDGVIAVGDMDSKTTYFLCPSPDCEMFFAPDRNVPCETECPWESQMKKIIKCGVCGKLIILDGDHFCWCRVDCECGASLFGRMKTKYRLIFEMPKEVESK
jgi:hypothetical protein